MYFTFTTYTENEQNELVAQHVTSVDITQSGAVTDPFPVGMRTYTIKGLNSPNVQIHGHTGDYNWSVIDNVEAENMVEYVWSNDKYVEIRILVEQGEGIVSYEIN